ncbi:MAG: hypothetical protein NVS4B6_24950 [Mycobacterium sp.]
MTEPSTNRRWLQTRVPGKLGILLSVLTAFIAGIGLYLFLAYGSIVFLIWGLLIFGLAGWTFAASVTKLRRERARSK